MTTLQPNEIVTEVRVPSPDGGAGGVVPQAGAEGRRLRDGRGRGARPRGRRHRRACRDRAHGRRSDEPPRPPRRGGAAGPRPRRRGDPRGRSSRPRRPSCPTTSAARSTTSGTWCGSTPSAGCARRATRKEAPSEPGCGGGAQDDASDHGDRQRDAAVGRRGAAASARALPARDAVAYGHAHRLRHHGAAARAPSSSTARP